MSHIKTGRKPLIGEVEFAKAPNLGGKILQDPFEIYSIVTQELKIQGDKISKTTTTTHRFKNRL